MTQPNAFTFPEAVQLAQSAVSKIDRLGARGTTLCTVREIEALAAMVVLSGVLLTPQAQLASSSDISNPLETSS